MTNAALRTTYRTEIDGLRAIAVIAVVIGHFSHRLLPGGHLGVDVFFVVSGYVITQSLVKVSPQSLGDFYKTFLTRRVKRLFPALAVTLAVAMVAISVVSHTPQASLKAAAIAAVGASNIVLFFQASDYFSDAADLNIVTHTWSLSVEEQFYLVFPLLCWMTHFVVARQSSAARAQGPQRLARVVTLFGVASLLGFVALFKSDNTAVYYLTPFRFWEIGAGVVVYLNARSSTQTWEPLVFTAGLLGVLVAVVFGASDASGWHLLAVFSTTLCLAAAPRSGVALKFLAAKPVVYVGKISYSLYLWHWIVLCVAKWTVGVDAYSTPILVLLVVVSSTLCHHFVEVRFRHAPWTSAKTLLFFLAVVGVLAAQAFLLLRPAQGVVYIGNLMNVDVPANLKTHWRDPVTGQGKDPCHTPKEHSADRLARCLAEDTPTSTGRRAFLFGDSHARNYLFAASEALGGERVKHLTIGKGCALMPASLQNYTNASKANCKDYNRDVQRFLKESVHAGDVVFLGQRLFQWDNRRFDAEYHRFIGELAETLEQKHVWLVLFDSTVFPEKDPRDCIDVPWKRGQGTHDSSCFRPRNEVERTLRAFDEIGAALEKAHANLVYAPLRLGLCTGDVCGQQLSDGTYIYHDKGHITDATSKTLGPMLQRELVRRGVPLDVTQAP